MKFLKKGVKYLNQYNQTNTNFTQYTNFNKLMIQFNTDLPEESIEFEMSQEFIEQLLVLFSLSSFSYKVLIKEGEHELYEI